MPPSPDLLVKAAEVQWEQDHFRLLATGITVVAEKVLTEFLGPKEHNTLEVHVPLQTEGRAAARSVVVIFDRRYERGIPTYIIELPALQQRLEIRKGPESKDIKLFQLDVPQPVTRDGLESWLAVANQAANTAKSKAAMVIKQV